MVTNGERDGTLRRVADLFLTLLNGLNEEKEVEFTGKTLEPTGKNGGTHCKLIIAREGWAWGGGRRWGRVLRGRGGGGGAAGII